MNVGDVLKYKCKLDVPCLEIEIKWEIDTSFKGFNQVLLDLDVKSTFDAMVEMNKFWANPPSEDSDIEKHIDFFLKNASLHVYYIHKRTGLHIPKDLNDYLFTHEEGFCGGECGIKLIDYYELVDLEPKMFKVTKEN